MSDKLGPIEIEFLFDKEADQEAKKLKSSLDGVGTSSQRTGKELKEEIKIVTQNIRGLTKDVKDLEKALKDVAPGKASQAAAKELINVKRRLAEEQVNLNTLQQEQVALSKREEEAASSLTGQISKWALSLGGAAAILKVLKDAFLETTAGINAFNVAMAAKDQVLYDIVSGQGLSMDRITSAMAIQKEFNELRIKEYTDQFKAAVSRAEYQRLYSESLDAGLSRTEKIAKIDEALKAHQKSIKIEILNVKENLDLVEKSLMNAPGSEKLRKQYAALQTQLADLAAEFEGTDKRLKKQKSTLIEEDKQELEDRKKAIADYIDNYLTEVDDKLKELRNSISLGKLEGQEKELEQLRQKYESDMEAWKSSEEVKNALTELYAIQRHEIEMKYLDKAKKEYEKLTEDILKLDPGRGYSILSRALQGKAVNISDINKLRPTSQTREGIEEQVNENLEKQAELRRQILDLVTSMVMQLGEALGLENEQMAMLSGSVDFLMGALSGDFTSMARGIMNVFASVVANIPTHAKQFNQQLSEMNKLLEKQERLIEAAQRKGGGTEARQSYLSGLQSQLKAAQEEQEYWAYKLRHSRGGLFFQHRKNMYEDASALVDDLTLKLEEAEQEYGDFMSGSLTENTIADAIAQGFADGKTSVDDFAGYMNDVLFDAALNVFKNEILGAALTDFKDMITEAFSDKVFTEEEKEKILARGQELTENWKEIWDEMMGVFTPEQGDANSLTGAIKGVTEETADILAGQMNAIRITQAASNQTIQASLRELSIIADNTNYCKHLESIDKKLDALGDGSLRAKGMI